MIMVRRNAGMRIPRQAQRRPRSSSTSSSFSGNEDSTPPERGRPFRRRNANAVEEEEIMEACMYMVVRREKLNQAVGRIVFLSNPTTPLSSSISISHWKPADPEGARCTEGSGTLCLS
ncbi:hypothetical protein NMY22_g4041 [Coprinellus aureogranulatus]|nr:hypothetical protein NMY22_g4041 [Coprinellus aureogranulatus]